jgi:hypothetical protein
MIMAKMKLTAGIREYSFGTPGGHGTFYFHSFGDASAGTRVAEFMYFVRHPVL